VAYCAQAVLIEAQAMAGVAPARGHKAAAAPFALEDLETFLRESATEIRKQPDFEDIAEAVDRLASEAAVLFHDLEDLEQRLTALEGRMIALAHSRQTEENLLRARRELDLQLRAYRGKMTAPQLAMLEKQYLERQLLESASMPRLSLFYLR
jgi:hypothetical protein